MIYIHQVLKTSTFFVILTIVLSVILEKTQTQGKIAYTKPLNDHLYRPRNFLNKKLFSRTTTTTTTTTTTKAPEFSSIEDDDEESSYEEGLQLPSEIEERFIDQNNHLDRISEIAEEESQIFEKISKDIGNSLRSPEDIHKNEKSKLEEGESNTNSTKEEIKETDNEDNIAIMDIPLIKAAVIPAHFQTSTSTEASLTSSALNTSEATSSSSSSSDSTTEAVTTTEASLKARPSRSASSSSKSSKKNSLNSWKTKSSQKSVFESSDEAFEGSAKKRENVPCTCGVFMSHQLQKGSTEPDGDAIISNELDKIYKCNSVGQKQCQTKCLETLVQHLPNSGNILCATLDRDIRKERAYLYIKNCEDKWISTSLTAGKEYCCKNGKPYSCPMV